MNGHIEVVLLSWVVLMVGVISIADGAVSPHLLDRISKINKEGPYLGIVVPNSFELNPLLQSQSFVADQNHPYLDFAGRRFRFGEIENKSYCCYDRIGHAEGPLELIQCQPMGYEFFWTSHADPVGDLCMAFSERVLHFGVAGNGNPELEIGDVTIPQYWAHTGLWNWQRYGDGPNDELALESSGDYTRGYGVEWMCEFYMFAKNTNCDRVKNGVSANVFVDNGAYREFLYSKFNATPIDMESAAVALVCLQQKKPFIAIRALSDLAGGGSSVSNEADIFATLAAQNDVDVAIGFISLLFH
ncbi:unnamed protein product [Ilex paraguariensis]|uniref:Nucleoside phosphorylase domain-containing protein n=1 Tax=Ilex paraguariensis TaxID=185542 RepID=A0ABC8TTE0_9AQUA